MKILIVRFSSIGDIVLTTPVIRCIKRQTGAEVHFLTKATFSPTLRHNPYVDRLWTIDAALAEVSDALIAERFTYLIDLHGNLRTAELKLRLLRGAIGSGQPPPEGATFPKLNFQKFLLTRLGIDRMPRVHIVDRYLAPTAPLGVVNDGLGLDYFIAPEEEVAPPYPSYLAFVIGAAHATKRLEVPQLIELCAMIDHPIVLLGGPAERELGEGIAATRENIVNACGAYSLNGSADLVRRAAAVITHDTGLMHIAAAFRRPIVSVWGNTVPALGMYPYLPQGPAYYTAEVTGLRCRPCSKIGYAVCPRGHFRCMRDQGLGAIARAALLAIEA